MLSHIGVVRPPIQTKPPDDEDTVVVKTTKSTSATKAVSNNTKAGINTLIGPTTTGNIIRLSFKNNFRSFIECPYRSRKARELSERK